MAGVTIYGADGFPMQPAKSKASMLVGGGYGAPAYDAADIYGDHTRDWNPGLFSPDTETAFTRDRIVSRVRDLVRNDGWASGAITRLLDNTIGGNFRPIMRPDYKALASFTGNKGFDADWAHDFGRTLEANYGHWANDPNKWCAADRAMTLPQMLGVAYRHKLIDGDALAVLPWLDERVSPGRSRYATTVQLIDPDRLSNPQNQLNMLNMRNGVEIDEHGAAIAYWIRKAHQADYWAGVNSAIYERMDRETSWGRPVTVLDFEHDRAGQHRGGAGVLTAVVTRLKMLFRYDTAELDSAIINAVMASYVESPFDPEIVKEAMGDSDEGRLNEYQSMRSEYRKDHPIQVGNAKTLSLFPGEKFEMTTVARPNPNFAGFEKAVLRNVASAGGLSSMQVTNDWSDVNYSSARGALMEFWKTTSRRRHNFAVGFAHPILQAFAEESFEVDDLPLPPGAPDFAEFPSAYCRAKWIGPPRGWMDPKAEIEGAVLGLSAGLMDFDEICAEQGVEADDMIAARAKLKERFLAAGAELPSYLLPPVAPKASDQAGAIEQPKVTP
jgi:lambda family phage portal protein